MIAQAAHDGINGSDIAVIIAAFLAMLGGVAVALINQRKVGDRIGIPNGKGNVVQMLEALLRGQTEQDQRMARIEERLAAGDTHLRRIDGRLDDLEAHTADRLPGGRRRSDP